MGGEDIVQFAISLCLGWLFLSSKEFNTLVCLHGTEFDKWRADGDLRCNSYPCRGLSLPAAGSNMQPGGQLISKFKFADEPLSYPHAYVGMVQNIPVYHRDVSRGAAPLQIHRSQGSMFCTLVRGRRISCRGVLSEKALAHMFSIWPSEGCSF